MPLFGNSFSYQTYVRVWGDVAVYRGIKFFSEQTHEYDEARVDLTNGKISFYIDTNPEPQGHWNC